MRSAPTRKGSLRNVRESQSAYARRVEAETARLDDFRERLAGRVEDAVIEARRANHLVLNRWSQVVDEERLTPVADSRFWIRFDDIRENDLTNTVLEYENGFGRKAVQGLPQTLRVGEPAHVTIDGSRYEVLAQSRYREKGSPFGLGHNDRVVVRIDKLASDSTVNVALAAEAERRTPR